MGTVEDFGTGEGLIVHFAAAFPRDGDEFKRRLSLELGRELAHRAEVGIGLEEMPQTALFLSPDFRAMLGRFDCGEAAPATMSYFARSHANYS